MAGMVAAQSVGDLVATNIEGVAGLEPGNVDKQEHWDWATQWSLPKSETLGLVVPGLFGYLPDSSEGMESLGKSRSARRGGIVARGKAAGRANCRMDFSATRAPGFIWA